MIHDRPLVPPLPDTRWAPILELLVQGTDHAVREGLERLMVDLSKARLPQEDIEHAQIVLGEVLNNIVEHAFVGVENGQIRLAAFRSKAVLRVVLMDNGIPMPGGQLPNRPQPRVDVPVNDLPEGGFGWHLIRALTDKLSYERRDQHNLLTLHIPICVAELGGTSG